MNTSTSNNYGNQWNYDTNLKLYHSSLTIPIRMGFYYQDSMMERITVTNYIYAECTNNKIVNFYSSENGGSGYKICYYAIGFAS